MLSVNLIGIRASESFLSRTCTGEIGQFPATRKASTDAEHASVIQDQKKVPALAFDHHVILNKAIQWIEAQNQVSADQVSAPDPEQEFSAFPRAWSTYTAHHNPPDRIFDRRNFSQKMLARAFFIDTEQYAGPSEGKGRPSKMHWFNDKLTAA